MLPKTLKVFVYVWQSNVFINGVSLPERNAKLQNKCFFPFCRSVNDSHLFFQIDPPEASSLFLSLGKDT